MGKHNHDIHFMLVVLVFAFFIVILSVRQIEPAYTANVVKRSVGVDDPLVSVFNSNLPAELNVLGSKQAKLFQIDLLKKESSDENIKSLDITKCDWINPENKHYGFVKSLSGTTACKTLNYNSCLMTNKEVFTSYYASKNSVCSDLQLTQTSNKFSGCNEIIGSVSSACYSKNTMVTEPLAGDTAQITSTSVLCCI